MIVTLLGFGLASPALAAAGSGHGPDGSANSGREGVKIVDAGNTGRAAVDAVTIIPGTEPATETVKNVF
ncbi:MAG: hypothetical protein ACRDUV_02740 [Pseudonocardiaceae bacterium]